MKIKVIQNYRGKFNLFGSEESLSLVIGLFDEENKLIEVDGVKAKLYLNKDIEPYDSPLDEMYTVFNDCFDYAKSVISSTDYEAQCILFAKLYQENYEEICENRIAEQKVEITKEIERLETKLKNLYGVDDISWELNYNLEKQISLYRRWAESAQKELDQVKEGTDKYKELSDKVEKYNKKIEYYNSNKISD